MNALVIGGSGLVGNALLRTLKARGHNARGTFNTFSTSNLEKLSLSDDATIADILKSAKPNWIFCPASLTNVDESEGQLKKAVDINCNAAVKLAEAGNKYGASSVFFSSEYVFDGKSGPYLEKDKPNPINDYGISKLQMEEAIAKNFPQSLILRTQVVYGNEDRKKGFVFKLLELQKAGQKMTVVNDQISCPTYSLDLAMAAVLLAEKKNSGLFHVAGPEMMDRFKFSKLACEVFGIPSDFLKPIPTSQLKQKARRPLNAGLLINKLDSVLPGIMRKPVDGLAAFRDELRKTA